TVVSGPTEAESRLCPACGTRNALAALVEREYRCEKCRMELAYVDYATNGSIRGIFGWLRPVGDTLAGRYRIKSVLGKGGFGATYLVEDLRLNGKRRALKEVPELLFDEYETTLLSRLDHPSIPDIIDRAVAGGMVYLVLEFGGSRTLGSERKRHHGRIPQGQLLPWMRQLCEALAYLHAQHPPVIHRDLKPDNILLDENEHIMLIDFGIAKELVPATATRTLGRAVTHGFSPPEQVLGTGTDERSDIYALGATFYALLTGQNPPAAHERVAGKELVRPSQIAPEIAPELEEAILRALSLNANHRQQSVQEFNKTLDSLARGPITGPLPDVGATERTLISGQTTEATAAGYYTGPVAGPRPDSLGGTAPAVKQPKPMVLLPLALIALILALLLTAAYLLLMKPDSGPAQPPAASLPPPVIPQVVVPSAPAEAKLPEVSPSPTQPAPSAMMPTPTPTPTAGTAEETPKGRAVDIAPPATPPPAATIKPSVKPRARPAARPPAPPVEKPRPAKPTKEEPAWTIIPGGARRTD
ncbi:MAG: serine/threonine protein kinase, partial [Proteobacteria bacterium]|nr:serine/threonine protein kinase [Pseudomonadota bacterium]